MMSKRKPFSKKGLLRYPSDFAVEFAYSANSTRSDLTICNRYEIPRRRSVLVRNVSGDHLRFALRQSTPSNKRLTEITKVEIDVDGGLFMRF